MNADARPPGPGTVATLRRGAAEVLPGAVPALVTGALLAAVAALLALTMSVAERAQAWALLEPRLALVGLLWGLVSVGLGTLAQRLWLRWGLGPARLADALQVALAQPEADALAGPARAAGHPALVGAVDALLAQRQALRSEMAARVAEAARGVEQERNRLAALMAELAQSVVVCNLDGRVLLFNARARLQFRALAQTGPAEAGGTPIGNADPLALGRSIYGVLDRRLVAHALEAVQQRLARGAAHPAAPFVTATPSGQLLRVLLAPVREPGAGAGQPPDALNGFVLMLENITRELAADTARDRLLHGLAEGTRGSLGTLQAAVELLDDPGLDAATRERFLGAIRDEIGTMTRRLNEAAEQGLKGLATRWPLEDMRGADLVAAAARRLEQQLALRVAATEVDAALWLRVDSYSLLQALLHLAGRLRDEYSVARVQLRLAAEGPGKARLDLVWAVQAMSTETVTAWESEPLQVGGETLPLTVREVADRHGGALWFERARARQEAFFRWLLPEAADAAPLDAAALVRHDSRPEFYDFDLFAARGAPDDLADTPLAELAYTVFDTETTGLNPSEGDEIIQIGATRIVAGKLRREAAFEQLVDPRRSVPEAGIAIHGIRPEQLQGQPTLDTVLPAFHAFAQDTVLVAHNAAFDLRFLQLKEAATGVRFTQPVLDTLLLSAVLHPQQESHRLEAIAERLGVPVLGRHTALGDAMVTAEVFLKMLPLLRAAGITTLGQALEASRRTAMARVSY